MPQAARKDAAAQRAQDKESKRARGAMSCAECRRLKLKCDKTVPCSSCKRRGCSAICPNGSLITGQGTRFVLADTEKLHQKIAQMSDRIRQLEDALAILQSTLTREPHPLLHRELLKIKSSIELHSAVDGDDGNAEGEDVEESQYIDAFGTLAIRDDGAATFYGRSAGSESLLIGETSAKDSQKRPSSLVRSSSSWQPSLPPIIANLASSFPLAAGLQQEGVDIEYLIESFLPPWADAWRLCELYLETAPWFFGAVTKRQIHEELLPMFYIEAPKPLPSTHTHTQTLGEPGASTPPIAPLNKSAHELALLFVIFCFGSLTDIELPPPPDNAEAEQWYQLTRAALALEPVLERPPSVGTVQALSLMAIYQGLCSGENSIESTWALMGLSTKLAQSIGLHRDCARWKLSPAEVQKRRGLFWELFITDCWQSLATGRLATFSLPFVDCELPYDFDQTMDEDGTVQPSFPFWKARFGAECVSAVVQGTLTSRAPKYSIILELDRKVRDMELPKYAQGPAPQGVGLAQTMSHFMPTNYRELTLLYIHRCFFAHAITSHPNDPIKSSYAPSFLAGYRSACEIIASLKIQFALFPSQIARFWVLWTHAFSSAVMLSSVVTLCSRSKVASAALLELRSACDLFEKAATYGGRAVKFLPILQRLQIKAQQVYLDTHSGIPPNVPNDIFNPSPVASSSKDTKDEFSIFSGKTHTVTTKASTPPASSRQARGSGLTSQNYTDVPSFAGVHPSLVDELHGFESHINEQLQNAYYENQDAFAAAFSDRQRQRQEQQQQQQQQQQLQLEQQHRRQLEQEQQRQQQQQQRQHQHQQYSHLPSPPEQSIAPPSMSHSISQQHQFSQPPPLQQQGMPAPVPGPLQPQPHVLSHSRSLNSLRHSQSHSSLQQAYNGYQAQPSAQPQQQPQHQLYRVNTSSYGAQDPTSSADAAAHYPSPETPYEASPTQYWQGATAANTAAYPNTDMRYTASSTQRPSVHQQYTPDGALRGIAADDQGLQETWQSFMYQVGSPRQFISE